MFLVYINDLLYDLDKTDSGLRIAHHHIPAVLLADDTSLVSPSAAGLQVLLDCVVQYAKKWRLNYNVNKSAVMTFNTDRMLSFSDRFHLGKTEIKSTETFTYARILLTNGNASKLRVENARNKARKSLDSLYDVGIRPYGINPLSCCVVWQRVILASSLYGAEIWGSLKCNDVEILERVQRHFSRFVQRLDRKSPCEATDSTLGLFSVESYIDKCKLLFVGRLCLADISHFHKQIFCLQFAEYQYNTATVGGITGSILNCTDKYGLMNYINQYLCTGQFPTKHQWKSIVSNAIKQHQESKWHDSIALRPELHRFSTIHRSFTGHHLWQLCYKHPNRQLDLGLIIRLGATPVLKMKCIYCNKIVCDIIQHYIISCQKFFFRKGCFI